MKLSDIFKLDLNTGGGNKLFARIMNKYNVPKKEYENVKQEMNSFGGGGDSGSSEDSAEYYKVNGNGLTNTSLLIFFHVCKYHISILNKVCIGDTLIPASGNEKVIAGKWLKNEIKRELPLENYNPKSNSFKDCFVAYLTASGETEELANEMYNSFFTPITKEEFYDLNNI